VDGVAQIGRPLRPMMKRRILEAVKRHTAVLRFEKRVGQYS